MKTRIVKIGNSQGIRIPKPLLLQAQISGEVELEVEENRLVIRPSYQPREHWSKAFEAMAERGDDAMIHGEVTAASHWDDEAWEWK